MLKKIVEDALNKQINEEFFSSYLYLSMAAYFESKNLKGFANWMKVQSQEEMIHVTKLFNYINERQGKVKLGAIKAPQNDWENPIKVFEEVVSHEKCISALMNEIMTLVMNENDHAAVSFLQWFIEEQVEEEAHTSDMLEQLKLIDGKGTGLFMLDREALQRVFVPPVANA